MKLNGLLFLLLFCLLVLIWSTPVLALDLKIATAAPAGSGWVKRLAAASETIESKTDGRVRLKIYSGGVMGNDRSVLRKIRIGQLHGATLTGGEMSRIAPQAALYSLPMLFHSLEEVDHIRDRMDAGLKQELATSGFDCFGFVEAGFARLMSNVPVTRLTDLRGQKIWVPEGDRITYDFMHELGLAPVTLPLTDVMTGLQTGLIDVIAAPSTGALAFQWHTRVDYMNDQPLAYVYGSLLITRTALQRVAESDRPIVRQTLEQSLARLDEDSRDDNRKAFQALLETGLNLTETDSDSMVSWRTEAVAALEAVLRQSPLEEEYREIRAMLAEQRHLAAASDLRLNDRAPH